MNISEIINIIGIPAVLLTLLYIGRKLQVLDDLEDVRKKFSVIESRVNDLWEDRMAPASSPRQLNPRGSDILEKSGIKKIVGEKRNKLTEIIKKGNPKNPYDAEQLIMKVVQEIPEHCPEIIDELKNGAFKSGAEIDGVLFVGGIYLRNLIFEELGFSLKDI